MATRVATCACGILKASCRGEPALVSLCHCLECQRRTGSTYGLAAFFAHRHVTMDGSARPYTRRGDSGSKVTFYFCPTCGTTLYWQREHQPDMVAIAVGAFADPDFPRPSKSVYEQHRHGWVTV